MSGALVSLLTSLPVLCMGLFAPAAVRLSLRFGLAALVIVMMLIQLRIGSKQPQEKHRLQRQ